MEKATKEQSSGANCKIWLQQRAGRITASVMHKACRKNPFKPSVSTIKSICYPEEQKFISKAMKWGKDHEDVARQDYIKKFASQHEDFIVEKCGLKIDIKHPFIGASPDSLVLCKCHQPRILEIKCPSVEKENGDCAGLVNGKLPEYSEYYYQIQTLLIVWNANSCDFVVWRPKKPLETLEITKNERLQAYNRKNRTFL